MIENWGWAIGGISSATVLCAILIDLLFGDAEADKGEPHGN